MASLPPDKTIMATEGENDNDNDWEVQRDQEKQYGNNAFKAKDFATAIHHYSAALSLDPNNHILLSNRSAAYLSSNQKSKALHDAQTCVEHSPPEYFKGYSRLAAALFSLGRAKPSLEAWEKLLQKDPNNAAAKRGKEDAEKLIEAQKPKEAEPKVEEKEKPSEAGEEEEDDLDDFFNDVEEATAEVKKAKQEEAETADKPKATNAIKSQKKDLGSSAFQIERLLENNYEWRNLNPFFVLDVPPSASEEEIKKRYKALSLLLHPDKNRDNKEKAETAFDQVKKAKSMLLDDANKAKHCRDLAENGMKQGKREYERLSSAEQKKQSLEAMQTKAIMRIFAQVEHKRREVEKRQRAQEQRERQQEEDALQKDRNAMKFEKNWKEEVRVDKRVGNWRDFQVKKKGKKE